MVILEEAAFVDQKVFSVVVGPMLMVEHATLIGISTAQDGFNYYSMLLDLIDPRTNEPRFRVIKVGLACDDCASKNKAETCEHRTSRLPPWQTVERHNMLRQIMGDNTAAFAREAMGLVASSDHFMYKEYIKTLVTQPQLTFERRPGVIFFAVDPSGGGTQSDFAIMITTFYQGNHVVSKRCSRCVMRMWCTNALNVWNSASAERSTACPSILVRHSMWSQQSPRCRMKGWNNSGGVRDPT